MEVPDLARENALLKARLAEVEATLAETQEANRRLQDAHSGLIRSGIPI